jgi:hypothetical protein
MYDIKPCRQRILTSVAAQAASFPKRRCHYNKLTVGTFIMQSSINSWISLFENVRFSFFNLQLPLPVLPIDH